MTRFYLRSYAGRQAAHSHPHHQLVLPVRGLLDMRIGEQDGRVDSASAAIIAAGRRHAFRGQGDNRFVVVDVDPDPDRDLGEGPPAIPWEGEDAPVFLPIDDGLRQLVAFFGQELSAGVPDAATGRHWSAVLCRAVARRLERPGPMLPAAVRRALAYMAKAFGDPLRLEDIAAAAGVSPSHLRSLFRRHLGTTVWHYLTDLRLAAACRLLERGEASLAEIAARCGFSDQSALTRYMSRQLSVTPGAYRRQLGRTGLSGSGRRIRQ